MTTIDEVKSQAQEQAGALAGRAKGLIIGQIDQRSTDLGQTVVTHAENIRTIADSLRNQGQEPTAKLADTAADRLEQLGYYLAENDGEKLISDVEDLARRQPMLALGAGVLLGFLGARLLKASASQRYQYYTQQAAGRGAASMSYYED